MTASDAHRDAPLMAAENVRKTYRLGRVDVPVLRGATLRVAPGEWVAVLGASGSGKSTLLHLLGGLDRPDAGDGSVQHRGRALSELGARALDRYRAYEVGFVFQFYHLLPELTVLENTLIAAMVGRSRAAYMRERSELRKRAESTLAALGLADRLRHRPAQLSGGERQRVAIARALMNEPDSLLADEPTGNLDRRTGDAILEAITDLRASRGLTIVMVTHDETIAQRADRTVRLVDGVVADG